MARIGRKIDKRKVRRQEFHARALVRHDDLKFSGELRNISRTGVYMVTNATYAVNDEVDLTIFFRHGEAELSVTVPGKVVRVDGRGIGLAASHIDVNQLLQLELMFAINKEHVRQLVAEFCKAI